jgi:hypothetical protein
MHQPKPEAKEAGRKRERSTLTMAMAANPAGPSLAQVAPFQFAIPAQMLARRIPQKKG